MKKIAYLLASLCMLAATAACSDYNKMPLFQDYYVAFDPGKSSTQQVNCLGRSTGSFYVRYCGEMGEGEEIHVTFSVQPGSGLTEGVDYQIVTTGSTLTFMPGIYSIPIHIRWLSHEIDPAKDNTLTLSLESCDKEIHIGTPGPDKKLKSLTITKFKQ